MELGTASKDLPDKCQLIDKRIKELKEAEKELGQRPLQRRCWAMYWRSNWLIRVW
jgi:hypothetical protein